MNQAKLFKCGHSVVVAIPKELLRKYNLRDGSKVNLEAKDDKMIIEPVKPINKKILAKVDKKFEKAVEKFMDEHEDVLKELAKR
jgi:putative addiction module antidote